MVQRDEYRQMVLAGTVSFPATFPQLGKLSLKIEDLPAAGQPAASFLSVTESPSARVTIVRRVLLRSVRAVFIPRDARHVNFSDGQWYLGDEIQSGLTQLMASSDTILGIAFVPENEPSMLNVSAGMTAGESAQYYPPLPNDPANNHYNAWPIANNSRNALVPPVGSCNPNLPDDDQVLESCSGLGSNFEVALESMPSVQPRSLMMQQAVTSCNPFPFET